MTRVFRAVSTASFASVLLWCAAGCGVSSLSEPSAIPATLTVNGHVHGGQQPVSGATLQLYATNMTANQGASAALLTAPVISGADGTFSITGKYSCPASDPLVYIVATGGNPGLGGSVNNTGIAMMSLLGDCNTLLANASQTFIFIDELTTVVAVQTLAPFMTDYAHIGSAPSSTSGVGGAFATATSEVDFSTGQFAGGQANLVLPYVTLNTMADIIGACINSSGGSGPCSTLFSNTGGTSNTIDATLAMVHSPGQSTATLYGLIPAAPPFQPYFTSVPTDFTSTVGYTVPSFVQGGALDSNGQVWLYFGGYNYDPASNTSTDSPGYIAVYDNNFNQLFTVAPGTGGLYYPSSFTADASGHVFAINANNTISEFASNGSALSPAGGWPTGLSGTFSPTGTGNNQVTNATQGGPIGVDAMGNIWGSAPYGSSKCYFELNSSGSIITPAAETFCTTASYTDTSNSALDGLGNAWAVGTYSIAKVNALGALAATAPVSQGCFYPESNVFTASNFQLAAESVTNTLRYDHVHNQLWGYSELGAGAITDAGAAVFCDYNSSTLPVLPVYGDATVAAGSPFTGGSLLLTNAALDGQGNLWFVTGGVTETGVVGTSSGTFTGTATYASYLGEISPTGALLTPYNPGTKTYGLQPAGFGPTASASATNTSVSGGGASVGLLGIDRFGNIWALDQETYRLLKITGLAAANTVNY